MKSLPDRIMGYAEAKPEATPIQAKDLLHLGDRAAVNRALSRLARSKRLMRICRGLYMRPIQTRFGLRAPSLEMALAALAELWGETIVANGGDAANWLGLTTQVPVRSVYLTSGPDRLLHFGAHPVQCLRAPSWQLVAGNRNAGLVIRAVAWMRPREIEESLDAVLPVLSEEDLNELSEARASIPTWIAEPLGRRLTHMAKEPSCAACSSQKPTNRRTRCRGSKGWFASVICSDGSRGLYVRPIQTRFGLRARAPRHPDAHHSSFFASLAAFSFGIDWAGTVRTSPVSASTPTRTFLTMALDFSSATVRYS